MKNCGGVGKKTRLRYCIDPPPEHGGRPCEGYGVQTEQCTTGKRTLIQLLKGEREQGWESKNKRGGRYVGREQRGRKWNSQGGWYREKYENMSQNCLKPLKRGGNPQ